MISRNYTLHQHSHNTQRTQTHARKHTHTHTHTHTYTHTYTITPKLYPSLMYYRLEKSEGRSDLYPMVPIVQFSIAIGDKRQALEMSLKEEVWDIRLGERYVVTWHLFDSCFLFSLSFLSFLNYFASTLHFCLLPAFKINISCPIFQI